MVGKYTVHRLILTLVKRKTEIEENHYITLNSFCPFARVMVNNLRDARICEIYQLIPQFLAYIELQFFPVPLCCTHWNSLIKYSLSSLMLLYYAIFLPLFVVSLGGPCSGPYCLEHYVPLGRLLFSSLVFEEFPYFLGYLKHTLCSLYKREDLGENLFNITTIGQIFPK